MSTDKKIKEDVENLFFKIYSDKKEPYDNDISRTYITLMLNDFKIVFPEEAAKGIKKATYGAPFALVRKTK